MGSEFISRPLDIALTYWSYTGAVQVNFTTKQIFELHKENVTKKKDKMNFYPKEHLVYF